VTPLRFSAANQESTGSWRTLIIQSEDPVTPTRRHVTTLPSPRRTEEVSARRKSTVAHSIAQFLLSAHMIRPRVSHSRSIIEDATARAPRPAPV